MWLVLHSGFGKEEENAYVFQTEAEARECLELLVSRRRMAYFKDQEEDLANHYSEAFLANHACSSIEAAEMVPIREWNGGAHVGQFAPEPTQEEKQLLEALEATCSECPPESDKQEA